MPDKFLVWNLLTVTKGRMRASLLILLPIIIPASLSCAAYGGFKSNQIETKFLKIFLEDMAVPQPKSKTIMQMITGMQDFIEGVVKGGQIQFH